MYYYFFITKFYLHFFNTFCKIVLPFFVSEVTMKTLENNSIVNKIIIINSKS